MVSARTGSGVSTTTAADGNIRVTICAEEAEEQGSSGPMTTNEHATSSSTALLLQVPGPVAKVDSNSNAITVNTTPTTTTIVITTTLVVTTTTEHNRKLARTGSVVSTTVAAGSNTICAEKTPTNLHHLVFAAAGPYERIAHFETPEYQCSPCYRV